MFDILTFSEIRPPPPHLTSTRVLAQLDLELQEKIGQVRLKDLKRKYMLFDADKTGMIDAKELGDVLRAVGLNPIEARVLVSCRQNPCKKTKNKHPKTLGREGR